MDLSKGREEQTRAKCEKSWERAESMSTPTATRRGTVFSLTLDFQGAGCDSCVVKKKEGEMGRERSVGPLNPSPRSGLRYNSEPMAISAPLLRWALAGGWRRWRREIAGSAHGMSRNACKKSLC